MARPTKHRGKWRIRWIDAAGKRRSEVHDGYNDAEHALRQHQVGAERVRRGLAAPEPADKTCGELCDYWLENRAPRKRSKKDDACIIHAHLRPAFGKVKVCKLTTEHTDRFVAKHGHLEDQTICNILTLLITMLNLAVDLGWLDRVPRIKKPRVRPCSKDYHWLRSEDELARFLRSAREQGELVFALYSTAVYTGMRLGELAALRWSAVDFVRRLITVDRSFHGPTKGDDIRFVPILDPLLPVLRRWRLQCPGDLVFPNQAGRMHDKSARIYHEVLHRVLAHSGLPQVHRRGKQRPYITFHGLRHTFASHWVLHGGDIFRLQKILGHKSIDLTMRYAHLAPEAFAEDLGRLGSCAPAQLADLLVFPSVANPIK